MEEKTPLESFYETLEDDLKEIIGDYINNHEYGVLSSKFDALTRDK